MREVTARVADRVLENLSHDGDTDDVKRLSRAFAQLEATGIIARRALGESLDDGAWRMHREEIPEAEREGSQVRGFAFFNKQALENAIPSGVLVIAYGAPSGDGDEAVAIGREIVHALEKQGLPVRWSGKRDDGIDVQIAYSHRVKERRVSQAPPKAPKIAPRSEVKREPPPPLEVGERFIELDLEGALDDPGQWDADVARALARREGIDELTEDHWKVILYVREYYLDYGMRPLIKKLCRQTGFKFKEIYRLFPSGPYKGAFKVAGMPGSLCTSPMP